MARSGAFLEAVTSYYSSLAYDTVALMRTTKEEMRSETYDWQRTASRAGLLWLEACDGWWSAMLASATPEVPTLFLNFGADSAAHARTLKLVVPGRGLPKLTALSTAGNATTLAASTRAEVQSRRDEVTIFLSGMSNPKPGTYEGFLYVDEQLVARVIAQVDPAPTASQPAARTAKGKKKP